MAKRTLFFNAELFRLLLGARASGASVVSLSAEGPTCVGYLNDLIENGGYQLAVYTTGSASQLAGILDSVKQCVAAAGLSFPSIEVAAVVGDVAEAISGVKVTVLSAGIGKTMLHRAIDGALDITPIGRSTQCVLDNDEKALNVAAREGYATHDVTTGRMLSTVLERVIRNARSAVLSPTSMAKSAGFFPPGSATGMAKEETAEAVAVGLTTNKDTGKRAGRWCCC